MWVCKECGHQFLPRENVINGINLLVGILGLTLGLGILAVIWLIMMSSTIWKDIVDGYAEMTQLLTYIGILLPIILGATAILCVPSIRSIKNMVHQYGYNSAKDYLSQEEFANLRKSFLLGFVGIIVVIGIIFVIGG